MCRRPRAKYILQERHEAEYKNTEGKSEGNSVQITSFSVLHSLGGVK